MPETLRLEDAVEFGESRAALVPVHLPRRFWVNAW